MLSIAKIAKLASSVIRIRISDSLPHLIIFDNRRHLTPITNQVHCFVKVFGALFDRCIINFFISIYIVISLNFLKFGLANETNLTVLIAVKFDLEVG